MEGGNRRQRWNNNGRSQNNKSPRAISQPTVPSWEKDFCRVVGLIDWTILLHKKKFIEFYDKVINWNDSAGEQAFLDAKKRYWSEINGFPCDIPLPDPDLYIDQIDWNSEIDPELLKELECFPVSPATLENDDRVVIFSDEFSQSQESFHTGWCDVDNYSDSSGETLEYGWGGGDNNDSWGYSDGNELRGEGWDNDDWGWGYNVWNSNNSVGQRGGTRDGRARNKH